MSSEVRNSARFVGHPAHKPLRVMQKDNSHVKKGVSIFFSFNRRIEEQRKFQTNYTQNLLSNIICLHCLYIFTRKFEKICTKNFENFQHEKSSSRMGRNCATPKKTSPHLSGGGPKVREVNNENKPFDKSSSKSQRASSCPNETWPS